MNRVLGIDTPAIYLDVRAGDVRDSQADITKARQLLGYVPLVSLEDGLRKTIDWCRTGSFQA